MNAEIARVARLTVARLDAKIEHTALTFAESRSLRIARQNLAILGI